MAIFSVLGAKMGERGRCYGLPASIKASRCSKRKARQKRALWDGGRADGAAPGGVTLNDRFP